MLLALIGSDGLDFRSRQVFPPAMAEAAEQELERQVASGVFGWAVSLRRPTMVPAIHLGTSLLLVPLATSRRTVGMLMVATTLAADAVEQEHLTLAAVVARQAAECIDNLYLAEELRRQNDAALAEREAALARRMADLGLLVEAARTFSGTLDRDAVLRLLVEATCRHLDAGAVGISLLEPDGRLPLAASHGLSPEALRCADVRVGDGSPIGQVAERGELIMVPDVPADPGAPGPPPAPQRRPLSFLGVPLVARERVIGVLSVMADAPREFTAEERALLTGLAAQGALATENAMLLEESRRRLMEQQRAMARLVQSARMASVGLLAGGVAHDINNPLCIISNHLQLLRLHREPPAPEVRVAMEAIEANVGRIAESIQALLEFVRARPGTREPTDLNEGLGRLLILVRNLPQYRRLRVTTAFARDLPRVDLDRAAWEQVILELLTNAREAMPEGGSVMITTRLVNGSKGQLVESPRPVDHLTTRPVDESGGWVEVEVEDDGPGIAPEDLPHVFDPFFTSKGPGRSMGLGLAICQDVVGEHGGRLWLESDGRRGTRVVIVLPASTATAMQNGQCKTDNAK
jgi:signal transduction histidine kinase